MPTTHTAPPGPALHGAWSTKACLKEATPALPLAHSFQTWLVELTSSEIFTARTWFAMVRTRLLEMSFSTVSWVEEGVALGQARATP